MKNIKIVYWIIAAIVLLVVITLLIRGSEDNWIKNSRGVYIEHGHPKNMPQEVEDQQRIIEAAQSLFEAATLNEQDLSSGPCLGTVENYAVDITHDPRQAVDDEQKNQCQDYIDGKVSNYIELDQNGEVLRVK